MTNNTHTNGSKLDIRAAPKNIRSVKLAPGSSFSLPIRNTIWVICSFEFYVEWW